MIELEFDIIQTARITVPTDDVDEGVDMAIQAAKSGNISIIKTECDNFIFDDANHSIPENLIHKCIATSGTVDRKSIRVISNSCDGRSTAVRL